MSGAAVGASEGGALPPISTTARGRRQHDGSNDGDARQHGEHVPGSLFRRRPRRRRPFRGPAVPRPGLRRHSPGPGRDGEREGAGARASAPWSRARRPRRCVRTAPRSSSARAFAPAAASKAGVRSRRASCATASSAAETALSRTSCRPGVGGASLVRFPPTARRAPMCERQDIEARRAQDLKRWHRRVAERRASGTCIRCGKRPPQPGSKRLRALRRKAAES